MPDNATKKSPVAGQLKSEKQTDNKNTSSKPNDHNYSLATVSFNAIKNTAHNIVNVQTGSVNLRTGASEYEQRVQRVTDTVFDGIGAAGTLVIGAATGNLPLAAISVVTTLFDKLFGAIQRQHEIDLKRSAENVSIRMANVRAGAGGRRLTEQ